MRSIIMAFAAPVLLVACSGGSAPSARQEAAQPAKPKVNTVIIKDFKFQPDSLTVNAGEIVEWKNQDIFPHTATAKDGKTFDSGHLSNGDSWQFKPSQKGTFDYVCTLHPNMKATLIVK
jgi:plastocyanin